MLLPTKTSQFWNQFVASVPLRLKIGFHVFSASLVSLLLALFLCAIILSIVSHLFIARNQHLQMPGSFMLALCMMHLHLSTHTRCAALERIIYRSLCLAWSLSVGQGVGATFP